jgi:hypothetical protein
MTMSDKKLTAYQHKDKRKNNPPVGLVTPETDCIEEKQQWRYDPHIDPALQFDSSRAAVEKLIDDALQSGDQDSMRVALETLKQMQSPYLNWTGKAEKPALKSIPCRCMCMNASTPPPFCKPCAITFRKNRRPATSVNNSTCSTTMCLPQNPCAKRWNFTSTKKAGPTA